MATTTNYGWTTPNDSDAFKLGASAIRTLGSSADTTLFTALGGAYAGLRFIKKQAVGTAVSSVSVTGAFSSTFEDYKILYIGGASSDTSPFLYMTLNGISGNTYFSSGYYQSLISAPITPFNFPTTTQNYVAAMANIRSRIDIDVSNPFTATPTSFNSRWTNYDSISSTTGISGGVNVSSTSATAFTLAPASGTITGGTIYVYGYGAS